MFESIVNLDWLFEFGSSVVSHFHQSHLAIIITQTNALLCLWPKSLLRDNNVSGTSGGRNTETQEKDETEMNVAGRLEYQ